MTRAKNEPYRLAVSACDRCSFKSESKLVMAHHWSAPLALGSGSSARHACHWCPFESKEPAAAVAHVEAEHGLEAAAAPEPPAHQCPLCPFEDAAKSKVTRHVMSCQKRFVAERNLEPPADWEPPAKIPRTRALRPYPPLANTPGLPLGTKGLHVPYHPLLPASGSSSIRALQRSLCLTFVIGYYSARPVREPRQREQADTSNGRLLEAPAGSGGQPVAAHLRRNGTRSGARVESRLPPERGTGRGVRAVHSAQHSSVPGILLLLLLL